MPLIEPLDEANRRLLEQVRPAGWRNPDGRGIYDLVVIGAGTAGLVSAAGAAGLGARVALAERALLGGDCLNVGCVPSKALLRSARAIGEVRDAPSFGVRAGPVEVDFPALMERMRQRRASISPHDSAARFARLGVDVFFGEARFVGPRAVAVGDRVLSFRRAVIATGGRPTAPPVPGLSSVPYLTNENLFWLTELPARLVVIGAGPIGCEMAQAFARFGSRVTLLDQAARVLPREDPDAAAIVERHLARDGVSPQLGVKLVEVRRRDGDLVVRLDRAALEDGREPIELAADQILVAAGRAPNLEALDLPAAAVAFDRRGVIVSDRLQTTNRRVYAAGDVCSEFQFTHAADAMARIVIQNALFYGRRKMSALVIPWCTYTIPEVAHVGAYEHDVHEQTQTPVGQSSSPGNRRLQTITVPLEDVDRAVLDDESDGFVRVHHDRGRLVGCTIVAPRAGELIGEASYVMTHRGTLGDLSSTIHPYPTQAEALRRAGDAYRRGRLTPGLRRWLERYFRWTR